MIYICDKCLKASCWSMQFPCDDHVIAGLYRARKADLVKLGYEHTDYMDDPQVRAPRHDKDTPMLPRKLFREELRCVELGRMCG